MPVNEPYKQQVALLIRTLPYVAEEQCFALKGGTAINLFVRNMPRLSVDIDLTYVPVAPRGESLAEIDAAMKRIANRIRNSIPGVQLKETPLAEEGTVTQLIARAGGVQIKIEVTPVLRGCVYEPELQAVSEPVEEAFGFAEIHVVSFADLYGGKLVAALDRQHPRDLFDVHDLLLNEGIDDSLRRAFVVYLLSHNRPMFEVLAATPKDITHEYSRGFEGMTDQPVTLEKLIAARKTLKDQIVGQMRSDHRSFLLSFESGAPKWPLLGLTGIQDLPTIRWRQQNLDSLDKAKREVLVEGLANVLGESSGAGIADGV